MGECRQEGAGGRAGAGFEARVVKVIKPALCTVCGACAGVCPSRAVEMRVDDYEIDDPTPVLSGRCSACGACYSVCPRSLLWCT